MICGSCFNAPPAAAPLSDFDQVAQDKTPLVKRSPLHLQVHAWRRLRAHADLAFSLGYCKAARKLDEQAEGLAMSWPGPGTIEQAANTL